MSNPEMSTFVGVQPDRLSSRHPPARSSSCPSTGWSRHPASRTIGAHRGRARLRSYLPRATRSGWGWPVRCRAVPYAAEGVVAPACDGAVVEDGAGVVVVRGDGRGGPAGCRASRSVSVLARRHPTLSSRCPAHRVRCSPSRPRSRRRGSRRCGRSPWLCPPRCCHFRVKLVGIGDVRSDALVPSPICPWLLEPQQATEPSSRIAQVWEIPELRWYPLQRWPQRSYLAPASRSVSASAGRSWCRPRAGRSC